jgi:hypothetical protein
MCGGQQLLDGEPLLLLIGQEGGVATGLGFHLVELWDEAQGEGPAWAWRAVRVAVSR